MEPVQQQRLAGGPQVSRRRFGHLVHASMGPSRSDGGHTRCLRCGQPGSGLGSVAARIGRLIPWEFDYRYDASVNAAKGLR
jgi:hypothetical protein